MPKKKKDEKPVKKIVYEIEKKGGKEAEILGVKKYTEGDMQITETAKKVDETTDILTTPWGTKVKANDVISALEEYYSLSPEDKIAEKAAWVELISKMMGENKEGLKIVDIELDSRLRGNDGGMIRK